MSVAFAEVCAGRGIAYVPIVDALSSDPVWTAEVAAGDGARPAARGYVRLAELVSAAWTAWIGPGHRPP